MLGRMQFFWQQLTSSLRLYRGMYAVLLLASMMVVLPPAVMINNAWHIFFQMRKVTEAEPFTSFGAQRVLPALEDFEEVLAALDFEEGVRLYASSEFTPVFFSGNVALLSLEGQNEAALAEVKLLRGRALRQDEQREGRKLAYAGELSGLQLGEVFQFYGEDFEVVGIAQGMKELLIPYAAMQALLDQAVLRFSLETTEDFTRLKPKLEALQERCKDCLYAGITPYERHEERAIGHAKYLVKTLWQTGAFILAFSLLLLAMILVASMQKKQQMYALLEALGHQQKGLRFLMVAECMALLLPAMLLDLLLIRIFRQHVRLFLQQAAQLSAVLSSLLLAFVLAVLLGLIASFFVLKGYPARRMEQRL